MSKTTVQMTIGEQGETGRVVFTQDYEPSAGGWMCCLSIGLGRDAPKTYLAGDGRTKLEALECAKAQFIEYLDSATELLTGLSVE